MNNESYIYFLVPLLFSRSKKIQSLQYPQLNSAVLLKRTLCQCFLFFLFTINFSLQK